MMKTNFLHSSLPVDLHGIYVALASSRMRQRQTTTSIAIDWSSVISQCLTTEAYTPLVF